MNRSNYEWEAILRDEIASGTAIASTSVESKVTVYGYLTKTWARQIIERTSWSIEKGLNITISYPHPSGSMINFAFQLSLFFREKWNVRWVIFQVSKRINTFSKSKKSWKRSNTFKIAIAKDRGGQGKDDKSLVNGQTVGKRFLSNFHQKIHDRNLLHNDYVISDNAILSVDIQLFSTSDAYFDEDLITRGRDLESRTEYRFFLPVQDWEW